MPKAKKSEVSAEGKLQDPEVVLQLRELSNEAKKEQVLTVAMIKLVRDQVEKVWAWQKDNNLEPGEDGRVLYDFDVDHAFTVIKRTTSTRKFATAGGPKEGEGGRMIARQKQTRDY